MGAPDTVARCNMRSPAVSWSGRKLSTHSSRTWGSPVAASQRAAGRTPYPMQRQLDLQGQPRAIMNAPRAHRPVAAHVSSANVVSVKASRCASSWLPSPLAQQGLSLLCSPSDRVDPDAQLLSRRMICHPHHRLSPNFVLLNMGVSFVAADACSLLPSHPQKRSRAIEVRIDATLEHGGGGRRERPG